MVFIFDIAKLQNKYENSWHSEMKNYICSCVLVVAKENYGVGSVSQTQKTPG
jgi:hypothetical protein